MLDEETQALDAVAMERIKQILCEYEDEMNNFELKKEGKSHDSRGQTDGLLERNFSSVGEF